MSAWRRLALELFPEQRQQIQNKEFTFSIYQLFFDLLPMAQEAHSSGDTDLLKRIYQFAEWCWKQRRRSQDIHNAVAVAFYEHLVDSRVTCEAIPYWLKPEVFKEMLGLFEVRMAPDDYRALLVKYNAVNHTNLK